MASSDLFDDQPDARQARPAQAPLIVEALLNQIRIEQPTGQVLVKGKVERLRGWPRVNPRYVFGELVGGDRSIEFRCPVDGAPERVGQNVVLSGTLAIKPSPIHQGFAVQLTGEVVGSWEAKKSEAPPLILRRRRGRVPLKHMIAQHGVESLCLIGSETGLGDARAALLRHRSDALWQEVACNVAYADAIRTQFDHACQDPGIEAIAFVRGGSDALTLQIWNDPAFLKQLLDALPPIYTALGHSQELLLADKYTDEAFATPTDLGAQVGQISVELAHEARLEQELAKLTERVGRAEQARADALSQASSWRFWAIALLVAVGVLPVLAVLLQMLTGS